MQTLIDHWSMRCYSLRRLNFGIYGINFPTPVRFSSLWFRKKETAGLFSAPFIFSPQSSFCGVADQLMNTKIQYSTSSTSNSHANSCKMLVQGSRPNTWERWIECRWYKNSQYFMYPALPSVTNIVTTHYCSPTLTNILLMSFQINDHNCKFSHQKTVKAQQLETSFWRQRRIATCGWKLQNINIGTSCV